MVEPKEVFDLLADEYSREILAKANQQPMSALELADACDAHHSTIYRRINRLQSYDLLSEQQRIDPTGGHHHTVYQTKLQSVSVNLNGDQYEVNLKISKDPVDRIAEIWREMRGEEL